MENVVNWRTTVNACLDIAKAHFDAVSNEPYSAFEDVLVQYITNNALKNAPEVEEYVVKETGKTFKCNHKGHTDKSVSSRFAGEQVYIGDAKGGVKPSSTAVILKGDSDRSKDLYKVIETGKECTLVEYLKEFDIPETNTARIRFVCNSKVSLWMVKNTHFDIFNNIKDVFNYRRTEMV